MLKYMVHMQPIKLYALTRQRVTAPSATKTQIFIRLFQSLQTNAGVRNCNKPQLYSFQHFSLSLNYKFHGTMFFIKKTGKRWGGLRNPKVPNNGHTNSYWITSWATWSQSTPNNASHSTLQSSLWGWRHSSTEPWHYMEVSGQIYSTGALPAASEHRYLLQRTLGGAQSQSGCLGVKQSFAFVGNRTAISILSSPQPSHRCCR